MGIYKQHITMSLFSKFFSEASNKLDKSYIQRSLSNFASTNHISFALGMPETNLLPMEEIREAAFRLNAKNNLQYYKPPDSLKNFVIEHVKKKNIACNFDEILITTGSQQAMMLISKLFINKGDNVIIDEVSYPGFIQIAEFLKANFVDIKRFKNEGIDIKDLEYKNRLKLMYTIPDGHNPIGQNLPDCVRKQYAEIARSYNIPIIEDDAYGFLNYGKKLTCPIKKYANDRVMYIGSLSKIIAPSLRIGWVIAPSYIIQKLEVLKEISDINTATFSQHIFCELINQISIDSYIAKVNENNRKKRDVMINALEKYIPEITFTIPQNGFYIWCYIPNIDSDKLYEVATRRYNISFIPGNSFSVSKLHSNYIRLSFSYCDINSIDEGIERLSRCLSVI